MKIGEVRWVALPSTGGREQAGRRPAIILQSRPYMKLPTVLVVPLTTNPRALEFAGTLLIKASSTNGLSTDSVALVFQLRAIDRQRIGDRLGKLTASELQQIQEKELMGIL